MFIEITKSCSTEEIYIFLEFSWKKSVLSRTDISYLIFCRSGIFYYLQFFWYKSCLWLYEISTCIPEYPHILDKWFSMHSLIRCWDIFIGDTGKRHIG
jgi:hypothetical protein